MNVADVGTGFFAAFFAGFVKGGHPVGADVHVLFGGNGITDGNHFLFVLMPFDSFIGSQVDFFGGGRGCNQQGQSRNNKKFLHYSLPFNFSSGMVIWVFPVKIIKFFLL